MFGRKKNKDKKKKKEDTSISDVRSSSSSSSSTSSTTVAPSVPYVKALPTLDAHLKKLEKELFEHGDQNLDLHIKLKLIAASTVKKRDVIDKEVDEIVTLYHNSMGNNDIDHSISEISDTQYQNNKKNIKSRLILAVAEMTSLSDEIITKNLDQLGHKTSTVNLALKFKEEIIKKIKNKFSTKQKAAGSLDDCSVLEELIISAVNMVNGDNYLGITNIVDIYNFIDSTAGNFFKKSGSWPNIIDDMQQAILFRLRCIEINNLNIDAAEKIRSILEDNEQLFNLMKYNVDLKIYDEIVAGQAKSEFYDFIVKLDNILEELRFPKEGTEPSLTSSSSSSQSASATWNASLQTSNQHPVSAFYFHKGQDLDLVDKLVKGYIDSIQTIINKINRNEIVVHDRRKAIDNLTKIHNELLKLHEFELKKRTPTLEKRKILKDAINQRMSDFVTLITTDQSDHNKPDNIAVSARVKINEPNLASELVGQFQQFQSDMAFAKEALVTAPSRGKHGMFPAPSSTSTDHSSDAVATLIGSLKLLKNKTGPFSSELRTEIDKIISEIATITEQTDQHHFIHEQLLDRLCHKTEREDEHAMVSECYRDFVLASVIESEHNVKKSSSPK